MRFSKFKLVAAASVLSLAMATVASAQATRTWVSGVGDDANPCSRTAPCKTFAGAISKTAAGGEIDVLDPGGFGSVTVTKSITIDGYGQESSVLNPSVNGIVVSSSTALVNLRNLSINGAGSGLDGVKILSASRVNLHNLAVFGQAHAFELTGNTVQITVQDCKFFQNTGTAAVVSPGGINTGLSFNNTQFSNNAGGGLQIVNAFAVVRNSVASNNAGIGIEAGSAGNIFIDDSDMSYNNVGVQSDSGGTVRMGRSTMTGCVNAVAGTGSLQTYGDNRIGGNVSNNGSGLVAASPGLQ